MTKLIQTPSWAGLQEVENTGRVNTLYPDGTTEPPPPEPYWSLPTTINIPQSGSVGVRQYLTNGAGLTISVTNLPTGVTYNSGTESLEGAASGTSSGTATFTAGSAVDTATVALVEPAQAGDPWFYDDFNYQADETNIISNSNNPFVSVGGWHGLRTGDTGNNGGFGTMRTIARSAFESRTGSNIWPGGDSNYALRIQAPNDRGVDINLWLGDENSDPNFIPADIWFQFWIYFNRYGTEADGEIYGRPKFLYPSIPGIYGTTQVRWMTMFSVDAHSTICPNGACAPYGNPSTAGGFWIDREFDASRIDKRYTALSPGGGNDNKFGPNLVADAAEGVHPFNEWRLMRIHYDTSTTDYKWEVWFRRYAEPWLKTHEWINGVTPNLVWTGEPGGHRALKMPTTIGYVDGPATNFYAYVRDFAIATSMEDLPSYSDEP